jgi:hypothetical protein
MHSPWILALFGSKISRMTFFLLFPPPSDQGWGNFTFTKVWLPAPKAIWGSGCILPSGIATLNCLNICEDVAFLSYTAIILLSLWKYNLPPPQGHDKLPDFSIRDAKADPALSKHWHFGLLCFEWDLKRCNFPKPTAAGGHPTSPYPVSGS